MGRQDAPADALFVGAPILVAEAGSPYDGRAGVVKKLSSRNIHVKLDDSDAFGDAPRILRRTAARLRSGPASAPEPSVTPFAVAEVQRVVGPAHSSGASEAHPEAAVVYGSMMRVSCTVDAKAGQLMHAILPDGTQHEVVVPRNVEAGHGFEVAAPRPASTQTFHPTSGLIEEPDEHDADKIKLAVGATVVVVDETSPHCGSEGVIARIGGEGGGIAMVVFSSADGAATQRLLRASTLRALDNGADATSFLHTWPPPSRAARQPAQLAAGVRTRSNSSADRLSPILARLRDPTLEREAAAGVEVRPQSEPKPETGLKLELGLELEPQSEPEPEPEPEPEQFGPTEEELESMRVEVERVESKMRSRGVLSRCVVGLSTEEAGPDAVELTVLVAPNDFLPIQETLLVARVEDLHSLLQAIVEALDLVHYYKQEDLALSLYVQDVSKATPLLDLSELPDKAKLHLWSVRKFWELGFSDPSPKPRASPRSGVGALRQPKVPPISHGSDPKSGASRIDPSHDGLETEMEEDVQPEPEPEPELELEPEPEPGQREQMVASDVRAPLQHQHSTSRSSEVGIRQAVVRDDAACIRNWLSNGRRDVDADLVADSTQRGVHSEGQSLLMLAATHGSVNVSRLLLDHGAVPDSRDQSGYTALMHAARDGHGKVISMLLECNADTELHGSSGSTALHFAAENGQSSAIQCLVNGNADMNAKDANDRSALEITVTRGHRRALETLIRSGALSFASVDDLDHRATVLQNAIDRAEAYGHKSILAILADESRRLSRSKPNEGLSLVPEAETPVSRRHAMPDDTGNEAQESSGDKLDAQGLSEENGVSSSVVDTTVDLSRDSVELQAIIQAAVKDATSDLAEELSGENAVSASVVDTTVDLSRNSVELRAIIQAAVKEAASEIAAPIVRMVREQEESLRQSVVEPLLEQVRTANEQIATLQGQLNDVVSKSHHLESSSFASPVAFAAEQASPIPSTTSREDDSDLADSLAELNQRMRTEREQLAASTRGDIAAAPDAQLNSHSATKSGDVTHKTPDAVLHKLEQSRQRSSLFLQQVQVQNLKMSGLVHTPGRPAAADHKEPSSPTDLPDGGVDTSRSRLRLVPSLSSAYESEEARLEKELIEQIRAEAEEVSFEEAEREAEEAVRTTQAGGTIEIQQLVRHDTPKSPPRLRGPSLSPLEQAMRSQSGGDESDLGSPGTPPSPSAIPRHQRLYGYERQQGAKSPQARMVPRNQHTVTTGSVQKAVASKSTPLSVKGRQPPHRSQLGPPDVPRTAQPERTPKASTPSSSPTSKSFKHAAKVVVASQRLAAGGLTHTRTNSGGSTGSVPSSPTSMSFKHAATAVVASQRFAGGMAVMRTNSTGSGRSTGDGRIASAMMSEEGGCLDVIDH